MTVIITYREHSSPLVARNVRNERESREELTARGPKYDRLEASGKNDAKPGAIWPECRPVLLYPRNFPWTNDPFSACNYRPVAWVIAAGIRLLRESISDLEAGLRGDHDNSPRYPSFYLLVMTFAAGSSHSWEGRSFPKTYPMHDHEKIIPGNFSKYSTDNRELVAE